MDNWIIRIRKNFPKQDIRNLVSENDLSAEDRGQFIRVPSSDYTRVFKCNISFDGVAHQLYLKKYLCRSTLDFVKHLFRPSRAKRAFNATLMLHENGFDAPAVIGLFEHCFGPFCTNNLLLTDEVENSKSMPQLLTDICQNSGGDTFVRRRALIEAFGRTIGQMHAEGIFHGDLRLGNVLVVGEEQKWRFFFIDNERTKKFYRLPDKLRLKNLVQINMFRFGITNTDRLRFFKTYLRENPSVAKNRQGLAKRILSRTSFRLRSERKENVYLV
jgi:tRNA A-37 threonylcarbamoyl transferase component Bud32